MTDREGVVVVGDLLGNVAAAVVSQLDAGGVDAVEQRLDVGVGEVERIDGLVDLGQLDAALLLSAREQRVDAPALLADRPAGLLRCTPHSNPLIPGCRSIDSSLFAP